MNSEVWMKATITLLASLGAAALCGIAYSLYKDAEIFGALGEVALTLPMICIIVVVWKMP